MARPMPEPPPVMRACLCRRERILCMESWSGEVGVGSYGEVSEAAS